MCRGRDVSRGIEGSAISHGAEPRVDLATQAEPLNQALVAFFIFTDQVIEQATALTDHQEQSPAGAVVLMVIF